MGILNNVIQCYVIVAFSNIFYTGIKKQKSAISNLWLGLRVIMHAVHQQNLIKLEKKYIYFFYLLCVPFKVLELVEIAAELCNIDL